MFSQTIEMQYKIPYKNLLEIKIYKKILLLSYNIYMYISITLIKLNAIM